MNSSLVQLNVSSEARGCLIVSTPYHALNALSLLKSGILCDIKFDLFWNMAFTGWEKLLQCFLLSSDVANVYVYKEMNRVGSGILRDIECAFAALIPTLYINLVSSQYESGHKLKKLNRSYSKIISGWYNNFTISLMLTNPSAEIILYEDGLASYLPDGYDIFGPRKRFFAAFGRKFPDLTPSVLYLNQPEQSSNEMANKRRIPIAPALCAPCFDIYAREPEFADLEGQYRRHRVVYLAAPSSGKGHFEAGLQTESALISSGVDVLCRLHPREVNEGRFHFSALDKAKLPWEYQCIKYITDCHILVGVFSTAQITPKMVAGIEPWVIFTFGLDSAERIARQEWYETILLLEKMYVHPERIRCVTSQTELIEAIELALSA